MARILLVDDDSDILNMLAMSLLTAGFEVATALGGEEALRQYQAEKIAIRPFDLVVLDLAMPYMNGFEVAQKIRDTGDDTTRIAFLTAHPQEYLDRAYELNPCGMWTKPLAADVFQDSVRECLAQQPPVGS